MICFLRIQGNLTERHREISEWFERNRIMEEMVFLTIVTRLIESAWQMRPPSNPPKRVEATLRQTAERGTTLPPRPTDTPPPPEEGTTLGVAPLYSEGSGEALRVRNRPPFSYFFRFILFLRICVFCDICVKKLSLCLFVLFWKISRQRRWFKDFSPKAILYKLADGE